MAAAVAAPRSSTDYPRGSRDGAATRPRGLFTRQPRWRRDRASRISHAAAAAHGSSTRPHPRPQVHSTAEELAALLWRRTIEVLGVDVLRARGVTALEVAVAEAPTQEARYRRNLAAFESAAEKPVAVPTRGCAAFAA